MSSIDRHLRKSLRNNDSSESRTSPESSNARGYPLGWREKVVDRADSSYLGMVGGG